MTASGSTLEAIASAIFANGFSSEPSGEGSFEATSTCTTLPGGSPPHRSVVISQLVTGWQLVPGVANDPTESHGASRGVHPPWPSASKPLPHATTPMTMQLPSAAG